MGVNFAGPKVNLCTGVFDGHGGDSAADYLSRKFYDMFSEEVSEEVYGKECSNEGWAHQSRCCLDIRMEELNHISGTCFCSDTHIECKPSCNEANV